MDIQFYLLVFIAIVLVIYNLTRGYTYKRIKGIKDYMEKP